jgi:hypothetical protein
MNNSYSCRISFGNESQLQTETDKAFIKNFSSSFNLKDFWIIEYPVEGVTLYHAYFVFEHDSAMKCTHFAQCAVSFALLHGMPYTETYS